MEAHPIPVGAIVTVGKAKTLWEVARAGTLLELVKVDGDGYVTFSKRPDQLTLQALPCQDITLTQLITFKDAARKAALDAAEVLRLWPEEDTAWAAHRAAKAALEAWTDARAAHYAGRAAGNIEKAIVAARAVAA